MQHPLLLAPLFLLAPLIHADEHGCACHGAHAQTTAPFLHELRARDASTGVALEPTLQLLLSPEGEVLAQERGSALHAQRPPLGSTLWVYARGYELLRAPWSQTEVELRPVTEAARLHLHADAAELAVQHSILLSIRPTPEAEPLVLDRWQLPSSSQGASVPVPEGVRAFARHRGLDEELVWPVQHRLAPGGSYDVRAEAPRLRSLPLLDEEGRTLQPELALVSMDRGRAGDWSEARLDALAVWAGQGAELASVELPGRVAWNEVGVATHVFAYAQGRGAYALWEPEQAAPALRLASMSVAEPRIDGVVPDPGTWLFPGHLDHGTLQRVLHDPVLRESCAIRVIDALEGAELPASAQLTAWCARRGSAFLERSQEGGWSGSWEPCALEVVAPSGWTLVGRSRLVQSAGGSGAVRSTTSLDSAAQLVPRGESSIVRGLAPGLWSFHMDLQMTSPAGESVQVRVERQERLRRGEPVRQLRLAPPLTLSAQ